MLTQNQLNERLSFVTGSDVSVICGYNKYKDIVQLWQEKTKRVEIDQSGGFGTDFGSYMENGIADWFSAVSNKELLPPVPPEDSLVICEDLPYMAGNFDRKLKNENALLECKTAAKPGVEWGDGENVIPTSYLMQVAHYRRVANVDRVYVAVVFTFTRTLQYYYYDKNENLEAALKTKIDDFWFNNVLADVPPEPRTKDDLERLFTEVKSDPVVATPETTDLCYELINLKNKISRLQEAEKNIKNQIMCEFGEHDTLLDSCGEVLATFKQSKPRENFDKKTLKKEQPEIYKRYVSEGKPVRALKLKGVN